MREDMSQVIVERPRRKPWGSRRKGRDQPLEELSKHEGMRRRHVIRGEYKELNENLSPLRRYLAKQVGRPWSKVYAEIAEHLRAESTVQQHVRDHLHDFVAVKPRRTGGWRTLPNGLWWQPFYVDPRTGLLCRTDQRPEEKRRRHFADRQPPEPIERIRLSGTTELRLINGIWYAVELAPLPEAAYRVVREARKVPRRTYGRSDRFFELDMSVRRLVTPPVLDAVSGLLVPVGLEIDDPQSWAEYRRMHPDPCYAVAKRTLSRKELREHGLNNPAPEIR